MISREVLKEATVEILRRSMTKLPKDIIKALQKAYEKEADEIPKMQLKAILDNIALSEKRRLPMCQDTGILIFYVTLGDVEVEQLEEGIRDGVVEGTKTIPLRPNAVHPLTRENSGTNIGKRIPYVNYGFSSSNFLEIGVLPKGAGSENMSRSRMLTPAQGLKGVKDFVLETVLRAGGNPCPPVILGIGIGGSADIAARLAKEALLRSIEVRHEEEEIAELEETVLRAINELGIGPMGLGGRTTALGVNVEYAYCHTASLPVAVNVQCWAARRACVRIYEDGHFEFPMEVSL